MPHRFSIAMFDLEGTVLEDLGGKPAISIFISSGPLSIEIIQRTQGNHLPRSSHDLGRITGEIKPRWCWRLWVLDGFEVGIRRRRRGTSDPPNSFSRGYSSVIPKSTGLSSFSPLNSHDITIKNHDMLICSVILLVNHGKNSIFGHPQAAARQKSLHELQLMSPRSRKDDPGCTFLHRDGDTNGVQQMEPLGREFGKSYLSWSFTFFDDFYHHYH